MLLYAKLLVSMLIWGGTWVSGRVVAREVTPFSAAFLRYVFASLVLVMVLMRTEKRFRLPARNEILPLFLLGLTGIFLYNTCFFAALHTEEAGRAALISASIPAFVALGDFLFLGARLSPSRLLGIPVSLFGVALILSHFHLATLFTSGSELGMGDVYLLACALSWAAYTILGKRCVECMTPLFSVTWACLFGSLLLLPCALVEGVVTKIPLVSSTAWGNLLFLGVVATGLAFCWYYEALKGIGASRAGVFINLVPVAAIILGVLILGEHVSLSLLVGGATVLFGVFLTNRPQRAPRIRARAAA
ncbi:protein of unknown function DUF6 transmembrane [Desulfovibrio sp. X2]|uniref:DMT family transporter n=1 Tax=Desulfovibrio sp. X2 TaxID=941449 RepID=UPI0003589DD8|nr:DMT family transporter [Desulfovibrio sp. X2]EPR42834.1 protein of unknown function DUF6 transmembrane [Desulfovibrio sp. X2]